MSSEANTRRLGAATPVAAVAALLVAGALPVSGLTSARTAASKKVAELGRANASRQPSCPSNCEAVGRVSGYQVLSGGRRNRYKASVDGRVVAWSIRLASPRSSQTSFFNDFYGTPSRARLSVLRPGSRNRFRLTGQSPSVRLSPYFGERPLFVLDRPLTIKKGYFVALTVPTWAPAFATKLSAGDAWRASRPRSRCRDVRRKSAHQKRTSLVSYGCVYRTARLLYTALVVPEK